MTRRHMEIRVFPLRDLQPIGTKIAHSDRLRTLRLRKVADQIRTPITIANYSNANQTLTP